MKRVPFQTLLLLVGVVVVPPTAGAVGTTHRVSVADLQADRTSFDPALSADGRIVAFWSAASTLVPGDTNEVSDIFVHDRQTGQTTRVSVASTGAQGSGSGSPALSADGRVVAFGSYAPDLVPGDTNGVGDIFVHDRQTGQTTRVSVASTGAQANYYSYAPALSADGRVVAFWSFATTLVPGDTNGMIDVFVHDRQTGQTTRVGLGAPADAFTSTLALSGDGRVVAFMSSAPTLVPGDTNAASDVFVHDRQTGQTTRVSVATTGTQGNGNSNFPALSADGRVVAFGSSAPTLVPGDTNAASDIFVHDRQTGQTTRVSVASTGAQGSGSGSPALSADGRVVAFASVATTLVPGDTNEDFDVFVHDRQSRRTTRVSVATAGAQGDGASHAPTLSADGRVVAFVSAATTLVPGDTNGADDVFVHDRQSRRTTRVSVATGGAQADSSSSGYGDAPALSADGRVVAFTSAATNLVPGDTNEDYDIFVHDRESGQTTRVSVATTGAQANSASYAPALSADGRVVAFTSFADNLVPEGPGLNWWEDIFVHDRQTGQTTRVSVAATGAQANSSSYAPALSADGRVVAFTSAATNLVPGDTNEAHDVFVHDRQTSQTTRVSVAATGAQADGDSYYPVLSADGRFVAFSSEASTLVPEDTNGTPDVFVHDRQTGQTTRVSVAATGAQAHGASYALALSADGRVVAFLSAAPDLMLGDTYGMSDVFVHDRQTGQTTRASVASTGAQANGASLFPATLSADGRFVAFASEASTLVPGDTNGTPDVFVRDRRLTPAAVADLALTRTDTPDPVQRGQTLTSAFTLTNTGPDRATGTTLVAVLSSHLAVTAITPSQGSCYPAQVLVCRLGPLPRGGTATVSVQATVQATAPATLHATATALANARDPKPGNNRRESTTAVGP